MSQPRQIASTRAIRTAGGAAEFMNYYTKSPYAQRKASGRPPRFDFVTGNPFEMPLPALVSAIQKATVPQHKDWFAYHLNERSSCEVVASSLERRLGIKFDPDDILMTTGGFAAMTVALELVADPGDEIIVNTPWFFLYPTVLEAASVKAVKVPLGPSFELDLAAIRRAITPRTRAILLNSPHNPSGRIVRDHELAAIAEMLTEASREQGRPVYLLSDEAFSRIIYDGATFRSPTTAYPHSILLYTYGKVLLAPGERIGYLALSPSMPEEDRRALRDPMNHLAVGTGFCFPNASLQHALPEIDNLSIDVGYLQGNRDTFREGLTAAGYKVCVSEGTFFMLVKAPIDDDVKFAELLAEQDIFVLPGSMCLAPGYLRVSLCAQRDTVRDSIDGWARALRSL